jgi:hypothetical protein
MLVDPFNANHPITLPFMDPAAEARKNAAAPLIKPDPSGDAMDVDEPSEQGPVKKHAGADGPVDVDAMPNGQQAAAEASPIDMFRDDTGVRVVAP